MKSRIRTRWASSLKFVISISLLVGLFFIVDWTTILANILKIELRYYLFAVGLYVVVMAVWSLRWHTIVRVMIPSISYLNIFRATLIGMFYSIFLPTAVGSDVGRLAEVFSDRKPDTELASTVLLDRLIGLVSLVLMAFIALPFGRDYASDSGIIISIVVFGILLLVAWVTFFNRNLIQRFDWIFKAPVFKRMELVVRKLYSSLHQLQSNKSLIVGAIIISIVMQSTEALVVFFIARSIGIDVGIQYFFIIMPIIFIIITIPISISGLGVRETAFVFFFTQVGITATDAVTLSLLYYSLRILIGTGGGILLARKSILSLGSHLLRKQTKASHL